MNGEHLQGDAASEAKETQMKVSRFVKFLPYYCFFTTLAIIRRTECSFVSFPR